MLARQGRRGATRPWLVLTAWVVTGLAATASVITGAPVIMIGVFLAFLLSANVVIMMLAVGGGASTLIEATVIDLVVIPASMVVLGRCSRWAPRWLDAILPGRAGRTEPSPVPLWATIRLVAGPTAPVAGGAGQ